MLNWFDPGFRLVITEMLLLFSLAMIISSIGFFRVVYFISIGYTFSIVAMAITTPIRHIKHLSWASATQNILLVLWGLRLGIYLVQREFRASYRKELSNVHQRSAEMSGVIKSLCAYNSWTTPINNLVSRAKREKTNVPRIKREFQNLGS